MGLEVPGSWIGSVGNEHRPSMESKALGLISDDILHNGVSLLEIGGG